MCDVRCQERENPTVVDNDAVEKRASDLSAEKLCTIIPNVSIIIHL